MSFNITIANKLEILQSLGEMYGGLALPPPLVLVTFHLVPFPLPAPLNHHPSLIYTYTINDSCFHPLLFLVPYLPEI